MIRDTAHTALRAIRRIRHELGIYGPAHAMELFAFRQLYGTRSAAIARRLQERAPFPTYLEIEVTSRCNLKCTMCEHTYWDETSRDLDPGDFHRIIGQFPHLWWIGLTGIGESFMHRDFFRMLRWVKARGAFVELFDTMFLVTRRRSRSLIDLGVDRMLVSLDAATASTYEALRVGSRFERVLGNVSDLLDERRRAGSPLPSLDFHFIVMRPNLDEVLPYLGLVRDLAGPGTTVVYSRMLHRYPEVEGLFVEVPPSLRRQVDDEARRMDLHVRWNADSVEHKPSCRLCTEWTMPFVFSTGEVIPCCAQNESNRRGRQKRLAMGNVLEDTFDEIWHGERYRELLGSLREGHQPAVCHDCPLYSSDDERCE